MDYSGYSKFVAQTYDSVVPYATRPDVEFFVQAARDSGGPVLELGCGTGRVLLPTARAGIEITGLDGSEEMLKVCRSRVDRESEEVRSRIRIVHGRMQDFDLSTRFSLITMPFRPFQHLLTVEDQISCLRRVHAHLRDGGTLILDIFNPSLSHLVSETGEEFGEEAGFTMPDSTKVVRRHRTASRDLANQILHEESIFDLTHPDGSMERIIEPFQLRYIHRFEAEHLLVRCGLELMNVYADYNKSPYGTKYPGELIMAAQRV